MTLLRIGQVVGQLNTILPRRQFILMGPGRWGSRGDIKLGVRVTYSDIHNCAVLIEVARRKGHYVPDVSFGTHFFQDLVESDIRYLPLFPGDEGVIFNETFLRDSDDILETLIPDASNLKGIVRVLDVASITGGHHLEIVMNGERGEALAFTTLNSSGSPRA